MKYVCCDERRRAAVGEHATINGIDYIEVLDDPGLPPADRQRTLHVSLFKEVGPGGIGPANVRIEGGERIRGIQVVDVNEDASDARRLIVDVDRPGDFSTYTLRLVPDGDHPSLLDGFDPLLAAVDFSFKAGCPSEFDCVSPRATAAPVEEAPEIDYLAKDFGAFRRLMLDRMALLAPGWSERSPADQGIALIELLAYTADQLSYRQDAVATEAYLDTARRRVSVRRHARLVDYLVHEGCNARVWVHVEVDQQLTLPRGVGFLTRVPDQATLIAPGSEADASAAVARPEAFESAWPAVELFAEHNRMRFYTWGDASCTLPAGATRATLHGSLPDLAPGHVLVFQEARGPETGDEADADPAHRHAVRLTEVAVSVDPIGGVFEDPAVDQPVDVTEIAWSDDDALPFPLVVSSEGSTGDVSVVLGNVVLADHGRTVEGERLADVPAPRFVHVPAPTGDPCAEGDGAPVPPRYRPRVGGLPLTHAEPLGDGAQPSAAAPMRRAPRRAVPVIELADGGNVWAPRRDLIASGPGDLHFVVEVEHDGAATLRFGDDRHGARPAEGAQLTAAYRVGNGARGNVGAGSIAHVLSGDDRILSVTNPLAAEGGTDPETVEEVRQNAPAAFRTQQRAVTAEDYADVAGRHPGVQRAAAAFRWTGSWRTVFVTVDRWGGAPVDPGFEEDMRRHLERYRLAGHDVEVDGPVHVALELGLRVCVLPTHFRSDVKAALLRELRRAFHPDNLSFGEPVYLSRVYAATQGVAGVESVVVTKLCRLGGYAWEGLQTGRLELGRLEIARLDDDPSFPERGVIRAEMQGGR